MITNVSDRAEGEAPAPSDSWGGETDCNLIRKASNGSPAFDRDLVWGDLIHRYEAPVRRLLVRHLRGDPGVEDATHDFFSDLFQQRHILARYDPDQGRFRCYIQGVVRRYALQWKRAHGTKVATTGVEGMEIAAEAKDEVEHEEELVWADAILGHAIERLRNKSKRDADLLIPFYGLFGEPRASGEELAKSRNVSPATLHVALHRARQSLHNALREELQPMVTSNEAMHEELEFLITRLLAAHPGLDLKAKG
jgi:RNA polymerase sigma factor (sigma-70 family)